MTDKEAMKLALDAQQIVAGLCADKVIDSKEENILRAAIKQALAAPAQPEQEPVIDKSAAIRIATSLGWTPQRKPLTMDELHSIREHQELLKHLGPVWAPMLYYFCAAIEAAHGIKENT